MKTGTIAAVLIGLVSLVAVAQEIRPIPKTSAEALAQCEATNRERGITEDCRETDFVFKTMKETEARNAAAKKETDARNAAAKAKADAAKAQAAKPSPRIGMSARAVIEDTHWGRPYKVSRTITAGKTEEQWVHGQGQYVNFTNSILTAIQD